MHLIEELQWRGMIQDIMPGTKELLEKEMVSGYIGFDPTSDSLHIGSLVPILLLVFYLCIIAFLKSFGPERLVNG